MEIIETKIKSNDCFYSESFFEKSTENLSLHIEAGFDFLNAAACNSAGNDFSALESFEFQKQTSANALVSFLEAIKTESKIFKHQIFRNVTCACNFGHSQLVPDALYEKEKEKTFFTFSKREVDGIVLTDNLPILNAKNIFQVPKLFFDMMKYWYADVNFHHKSTAFINACIADAKNMQSDIAYLDFANENFEIAAFKNRKLILNNRFEVQTAEDVLYYLLFVLEQLQMPVQQVSLTLSGKIDAASSRFSLLKKYFEKVLFASNAAGRNIELPDSKIKYHNYFTLLNLGLCAS